LSPVYRPKRFAKKVELRINGAARKGISMVHQTGSFMRIAFCVSAAFLALDSRTLADDTAKPSSSSCFEADARDKSLREAGCKIATVRLAANSGEVYAQNQLGLISALQVRNGGDIREARDWFEKAARRGYAPAQVNLAVTYLNGWGTPQSYGSALNWLNAAAKQGHPRAYANLGILYMNGWGVRRDFAEAFRYLQLAADAGDAGAQANLGYLYDGGFGVVKDYSAAARLYRLCAEQGNALGQNNLADLYLRGLGVQQSYSDAFYWFEKSAQQGYTAAQIKRGFLLMNGLGCAKDPIAAYSSILAASKAGDHRGDEYLETLKSQLDQPQLAQVNTKLQSQAAAANSGFQSGVISFVP
jgi:TPR repeat protein